MSDARFAHRRLLLLAGLVLGLLLTTVGVAQASFGELSRFGAPGLNASEEGEVGKLTPSIRDPKVPDAFDFRPWHVIGVEPNTNDVYVLEEYKQSAENEKEEATRFFRLQEFNAEGAFLAHKDFTFTSPPARNFEDQETIEGIAVDPEAGRLYFLVTEQREEKKPEEEENVAASLYAFNTTPNSSNELEAAPSTTNGVLAGPEKLQPTSKTANVPLLQPQGITVDPHTHEVVILAHQCEEISKGVCEEDELEFEPGKDHYVTQRVKENGDLGERFVDSKDVLKQQNGEEFVAPASPVVAGSGASERLLANDFVDPEEGSFQLQDFLDQFPASASGTPTRFQVPDVGGSQGPFEDVGEEGDGIGGDLAVSPGGQTLYGLTHIENEEAEGTPKSVYGISVRSAETLTPIGWTGGQQADASDKCVLEPGINDGERIQLAAGSGGKIFVLVPEYLREPAEGHFPTKDAIIELGEGGEGCPQASAGRIVASVNGKEVSGSLGVKKPIVFSSFIKQGDALSVKWSIEDETTHAPPFVEEQSTDQFQHPTLKHEFLTEGKYKITEEVKTDNLDTPTLSQTRIGVEVEANEEAIKVTKQPESAEVLVGTPAKFTATATGKPSPSVKWFVSHDKGVEFIEDTEDKGSNTGTLEVATTKAKNGFEYHAVFENQGGTEKVPTNNATLTVTTAAPKVTEQPVSRSVTAGASASFSSAATGGPPPTLQWEVSSNHGASWTPISGATAGTLTIFGTTLGESGFQYRALFTNEVGSQASNAATLTVSAPPPPPPPPPPPSSPPPTSTPPGGGVSPIRTVSPTAMIAGASSVTVSSSGVVSMKVSCLAGATECIGTVTLRTLKAVSAGARATKSKKAILTLATGSFSVTGGQAKTVTLHLSAAARKLLARSRVLLARATVAAHDPAGEKQTTSRTLTLRLAKPKHKR